MPHTTISTGTVIKPHESGLILFITFLANLLIIATLADRLALTRCLIPFSKHH